ncbi:MAG: TIGR00282 family metallophosphoesterase [Dehalococcoidia bacterium]|nr:TIGR00282 family metallophosphoesterase [Dehalococcoidia bacterium]MDP6226970.1 TIGR00282 family metallophosphoesterase [Dehalococcoidia bacterium]MDP7083992.1 TIGR00282 family metallophosphoesterase [Dehalococcoidia bacterium]MDP7199875.1 TIGR00282 family metallophosphoesterase [Dehalococcoidia bacterium]MDP7510618.1 TIGR00282 family metallophosphoesterase [Dehalococcoidia bacterium]
MRILMIGDVIGKPGRRALQKLVPLVRQECGIDMVIANAENTAGGFGLTLDTAYELLESGVDVLTSGNHIWDQREIIPHMDGEIPLVRPANYPNAPGRGSLVWGDVMVVNLIGRVFLPPLDCPFRTADQLLNESEAAGGPRVIIVDFHAEATSEKQALGWYLDGRVSAVVGTHTHVGTVDTKILPQGTAYVTDVGMTGPADSVIGSDPSAVLERFLSGLPQRLTVARGPVLMNSVLLDIDVETGKAQSIERLDRMVS